MRQLNRLGVFFAAAGKQNCGSIFRGTTVNKALYCRCRQFGCKCCTYLLKAGKTLHDIFEIYHAVNMGTFNFFEQGFGSNNGIEVAFLLGIYGILFCTCRVIDHYRNATAHEYTQFCKHAAC